MDNVSAHSSKITGLVANSFGISRQAAHRHVARLVSEGSLFASGETRKRRYEVAPIAQQSFSVEITPGLQEDAIWRERVRPLLGDVSANVLGICEYAYTEFFNNVLDHSVGTIVRTSLKYAHREIWISLGDNGVGIFQKIQSALHLDDERHAVLELAKGKLTTDPAHHTGEGIFFASRAVDYFTLQSGALLFTHTEPGDDWLLEEAEPILGTRVSFRIDPESQRTLKGVFDQYAIPLDDYGFARTRVAVALARYGDESLVSRSQAKRLLARFDRFREVELDFKGVATIGQAFADEIFRVYAAEHPGVRVTWDNASDLVRQMIRRAQNQREITSAL